MCDNTIGTAKNIPKSVGAYILNQELGRGSFGVVYLGTNQFTGVQVAVKILDKNELQQNQSELALINNEVTVLKLLFHKNIAKLYEVFESTLFIYIVTEYCDGKELFEFIYLNQFIPENQALVIFQEIIDAMIYMHSMQICHRDIKPENVLLTKNGKPKLVDFGFSTQYSNDDLLKEDYGTPSYACPEMHKSEDYHGMLADSWSCGVLLYVMVCGYLPFNEEDEHLIIKGEYDLPDELSESVKDLIRHMMEKDPSQRYNFTQVKDHPWFNSNSPKLIGGINIAEMYYPIDERILRICEAYGLDKEVVRQGLQENKFNNSTAVYQLCVKTIVDRGMTSISDLFSAEFQEYINDKNNLLEQEDADMEEVEEVEVEEVEEEQQEQEKISHKNEANEPTCNSNEKKEEISPPIQSQIPITKKSTNSIADNKPSTCSDKEKGDSEVMTTDFDDEIRQKSRRNSQRMANNSTDKGGDKDVHERRNRIYSIEFNGRKSIQCGKMIINRPKLHNDQLKIEFNSKKKNPNRRNTCMNSNNIEEALNLYFHNDNRNEEKEKEIEKTDSNASFSIKIQQENSFAIIPEEDYLLTTDSNLLRESIKERSSVRRSTQRKQTISRKEDSATIKEEYNENMDFPDENNKREVKPFDLTFKTQAENQCTDNHNQNHSKFFLNDNNITSITAGHSSNNLIKKNVIAKGSVNQYINKKPSVHSNFSIDNGEIAQQNYTERITTHSNQQKGFTALITENSKSIIRYCDSSVEHYRISSPIPVRDLSFSPKLGMMTKQNRIQKMPWVKKKRSLKGNKEMEEYLIYRSQMKKENMLKKKIKDVKAKIKPLELLYESPYPCSNKYKNAYLKQKTVETCKLNNKTKRLVTEAPTPIHKQASQEQKLVDILETPITPLSRVLKSKKIARYNNKSIDLTNIQYESIRESESQSSPPKIYPQSSVNTSCVFLMQSSLPTQNQYYRMNTSINRKPIKPPNTLSPNKNNFLNTINAPASIMNKGLKRKSAINKSISYKGTNLEISIDLSPNRNVKKMQTQHFKSLSSYGNDTSKDNPTKEQSFKNQIEIRETIPHKQQKKIFKSKTNMTSNKPYSKHIMQERISEKPLSMSYIPKVNSKISKKPRLVSSNVIDLACISNLTLDETIKRVVYKLKKNNVIFSRKANLYEFHCMKNGVTFEIEIIQIEGYSDLYYNLIKLKSSGLQISKKIVSSIIE